MLAISSRNDTTLSNSITNGTTQQRKIEDAMKKVKGN